MTGSVQDKPRAPDTVVETASRGMPRVDVPEAELLRSTDGRGRGRLRPHEDDSWGEDAPQMAEGKWFRHTFLRASESLAGDVPDGESRMWPGWPGACRRSCQCQHCKDSQPSLLTVSTRQCPDRDPSRKNYLVPPCPYRCKTHFLLALLSRSPLPPPLHSISPPPSLLDVLGDGVRSLRGDREATGVVAVSEVLSRSTCPPALQTSPRKVGRSFA